MCACMHSAHMAITCALNPLPQLNTCFPHPELTMQPCSITFRLSGEDKAVSGWETMREGRVLSHCISHLLCRVAKHDKVLLHWSFWNKVYSLWEIMWQFQWFSDATKWFTPFYDVIQGHTNLYKPWRSVSGTEIPCHTFRFMKLWPCLGKESSSLTM